MKITDEILELYKQRHKKEWEKFKHNEKLWRQWVYAKEKEKIAKEKIQRIMSKDRTRALIVLATEMIRLFPGEIKKMIEQRKINLVQRKGKKDFDYSSLILEEIEKILTKS